MALGKSPMQMVERVPRRDGRACGKDRPCRQSKKVPFQEFRSKLTYEESNSWSRITSFLSSTHDVAAFVSFLIFLVNGRYRTLIDRFLGLRLVAPTNQVRREVSFEYLNRQLVWHAFTEFLLFLLPLMGINRWRRWLSKAWRKAKSFTSTEEEIRSMVR